MKKVLSILMAALMFSVVLTACAAESTASSESSVSETESVVEESSESSQEESSVNPLLSTTQTAPITTNTINIAGLKGPTSMGMVKLLDDAENELTANQYNFTIAGSADEITPKLVKGELDIVAVPANLASVLYNNTAGEVQLLAVNTLGVIYIVDTGDSVQSLEDLKGKTIYATGKGSTPEYALNYILQENGIDPETDVTIEWKSEPTEVVAMMQGAEEDVVAMLPQPYVTVAQTQVESLRIAIDLNQEWENLDNGSLFLTGVLVVRKDFAEQNTETIENFLTEYQASTEYVTENIEEAATLIEKYDIVKAAIATKALPYCNITYMDKDDMKLAMEGYLQVLYDQNPASVGGALPADDFYYGIN